MNTEPYRIFWDDELWLARRLREASADPANGIRKKRQRHLADNGQKISERGKPRSAAVRRNGSSR